MNRICYFYTYLRYGVTDKYLDDHSLWSKGLLIIAIINVLIFMGLEVYFQSNNLFIARIIASSLIIVACTINLFLPVFCKKIDRKNLLYFQQLSAIGKCLKNRNIARSLFPVLYYSRHITKREDVILWNFIICSYFQEENRILTKAYYLELLDRLFADPIINKAYQSDIGFRQEAIPDGWTSILEKYLSEDNLIKWPIFYGWINTSIWCSIPHIHQSGQEIGDAEKAHQLYLKLEKASKADDHSTSALTKAEYKFMDHWLESRENKSKCMHLYPSLGVEKSSQRDTVEEANHYYQATIQARLITKEVLESENHQEYYNYKQVGLFKEATPVITNSEYPERSVFTTE